MDPPQLPPGKTPHPNSQTQTKKIVLKLKVTDQDLADGKYRQTAPLTTKVQSKRRRASTPASQTARSNGGTRGRGTGRGRGRGRGRGGSRTRVRRNNSNINLNLLDPDEDENGEQEEQPQMPTLSDFRPVSLLSFPMLVTTKRPIDLLSAQPQPHSQTKCCAACGIPATAKAPLPLPQSQPPPPIAPSTSLSNNQNNNNISATPPPWSLLNLHPTRHINAETNSITDLVITRKAPHPNTADFWYDLTIAELAKKSTDIDFKMLCLNLMRWKSENDDAGVVAAYRSHIRSLEGRGAAPWESVVAGAVAMGKAWRKARRLKETEGQEVAALAVWEARVRRRDRGRFVVDDVGAWVSRAPGLDGEVRRILKLGYRRVGGRGEGMNGGGFIGAGGERNVDGDEGMGD